MPDAQRRFTVIDGGTGNRTLATLVNTGVLDDDGNPLFRPGSGGGDGGGGGGSVKPLWSLDVERDVQIAKWGLAALVGAFAFGFMYFNGEFKEVRKDIAGVNQTIAGQSATISAMQTTLGRIEDKLDANQSQGSAGAGQVGQVRQGAKP